MLKAFRLSFLITILALVFASISFAQEEDSIKPFGGLEWEDGLLDVLTKLNRFDGIEQIKIMKEGEKGIDIKGDIDSKKIAAKLTEVIKQWNELYLNPNDIRVQSSPQIATYFDSNERERKCINTNFIVEAYPVLIKNVPFKMQIVFNNAVGFAIDFPNKTLTEIKGIYTFPLIIKQVDLYSSSPALADHYREINDVLKNKYGKFDSQIATSFEIDRLEEGDVVHNGVRLSVTANESTYRISYIASREGEKRLAEVYRKHLSGLESQKLNRKKDFSSEL